MPGVEFDAAVDEYLHAIVRTRPWTKKREAELLTLLSDWLYAQPDLSVQLASVAPPVVRSYYAATGLDDAEQDDLQVTLIRLRVWTEVNGYLQSSPHAANVAT